jgi:hypothetical protein
MAVAITMDFAGGTLEQYDRVMELMELDGTPPGALFHWVASTGDGIRVVDVWETQEQFDRFAAEKIGPTSAQVGIDPPTMAVHEVHNYLTA